VTILDTFTDILDGETLSRLGDPVVYRRLADFASPLSINAYVDHSDEIRDMLGGAAVTPDVTVTVRVSDVARPVRGDMIELPRRGETRKVTHSRLDTSGRWWIIRTDGGC
jgi:hypothetical protein